MMPEKVELEEWKREEMADCERYQRLAAEYPALAKLFEFMAADEHSHADIIDAILTKY